MYFLHYKRLERFQEEKWAHDIWTMTNLRCNVCSYIGNEILLISHSPAAEISISFVVINQIHSKIQDVFFFISDMDNGFKLQEARLEEIY